MRFIYKLLYTLTLLLAFGWTPVSYGSGKANELKKKSQALACKIALFNDAQTGHAGKKVSLSQYISQYQETLFQISTWWRFVEEHAVDDKIANSRVTLQADNHLMANSQLFTVRLMELKVSSSSDPLTLVVEWVSEAHQGDLDDFLRGEIDLLDLRERIAFNEFWGFPWKNYEPILVAARELGVRILAVEGERSRRRDFDAVIAQKVKSDSLQHPDMRYLISYGSFHILGKGHLRESLAAMELKPDVTLIDEAEDVFWKAFSKNEDFRYIRFADDIFYFNIDNPYKRKLVEWLSYHR